MPFVVQDEDEHGHVALQPWQANPYQLVTWLDMLEFSARMFFWTGSALESIIGNCLVSSLPVAGDTPIFNMTAPINEGTRSKSLEQLAHVEEQFRQIGLPIAAETSKELMTALQKNGSSQNFQWLIDQIQAIRNLAHKELRGKAFFYVPAERTKFFPTKKTQHLFGDAVGAAFPSATFDIAEAGISLALARGTGCVFHLMRALEVALSVLGNKFGVSLAHTNWAPAIEEIERKTRNLHKEPAWKLLPDYKEQQEFYSQAASHFGVLKDAWHNYTMHARGFYTEEQAARIFENVKGFMEKLSERLHE
ncbi:MAG: hypothetical protein ACRD37_01110 [Candidatus Acidiferrales bacterium]